MTTAVPWALVAAWLDSARLVGKADGATRLALWASCREEENKVRRVREAVERATPGTSYESASETPSYRLRSSSQLARFSTEALPTAELVRANNCVSRTSEVVLPTEDVRTNIPYQTLKADYHKEKKST